MRRIISLFTSLFLGLTYVVTAQPSIEVSGRITDSSGEGIPGVNIILKNSPEDQLVGTVSDVNGEYTLALPSSISDPVLEFTSVGYVTQSIPVAERRVINVSLEEFESELDEVVVIGYRSADRRSITGSISFVEAKDIEEQNIISFQDAINSRVAGVRVLTTSGRPGDAPQVYIRGISSLSSSLQPLYVVDGIPLQRVNLTTTLASEDIESFTVLKDASATVLYGSRASNGVILVRTRRSTRASEPRISALASGGVSSLSVQDPSLPGAERGIRSYWEAVRNTVAYSEARRRRNEDGENYETLYGPEGTAPDEETRNAIIEQAGEVAANGILFGAGFNAVNFAGINYNPYGTVNADGLPITPLNPDGTIIDDATLKWDTDWIAASKNRNPFNQTYHLNVQGGTPKFRYYTSGTYRTSEGEFFNSSLNRVNLRVNMEADPTPWASVGILGGYNYSEVDAPVVTGSFFNNPTQGAFVLPSYYPIYQRDPEGNLILEGDEPIADDGRDRDWVINDKRNLLSPSNPPIETELNEVINQRTLISLTPFIEVRLMKGLNLRSSFGYNDYTFSQKDIVNSEIGGAVEVQGALTNRKNRSTESTFSNKANYARTFGSHDIDALALVETYQFNISALSGTKTQVVGEELATAGPTTSLSGNSEQERIFRFGFGLTYGFRKRYYLEWGFSRDALSRFNEDFRRSNFSSVGATWIASDEPFFPKNNVLTGTRFRLSYGTVGNNEVPGGLFPAEDALDIGFNHLASPGVLKTAVVDNALTWEKTSLWNAGLDLSFLRDRITLTVEYFKRETLDLVLASPLPLSTGFSGINTNQGKTQNTGVDVTIGSVNIDNRNLVWTTDLNLGHFQNVILELPRNNIGNWEEGRSRFYIRTSEFANVDPQTGLPGWYYTQNAEISEGGYFHTQREPGSGFSALRPFVKRRVLIRDQEAPAESGLLDLQDIQNDIYLGSSLPFLSGGLSNRVTYREFSFSFTLGFEFGGILYDDTGANAAFAYSNMQPRQTTNEFLDATWKTPGQIASQPILLVGDSGFDSPTVDTRNYYSRSHINIRSVHLSYSVPQRLLNRTAAVRALLFFVTAQNVYTFSLDRDLPKAVDPTGVGLGSTFTYGARPLRLVEAGVRVNF